MAGKTLHQDRPIWGLILRFAAIFLVATTFALVKHTVESGAHILETLFYRYLVGCIFVIGYILIRKPKGALKTKRPWSHLYRAIVGIISMGLNFWAFTLMPLAEASVISFAMPLMAVIFSVILLSEVVGIRRWTAVLIGFVGIVIAVRPDGAAFTTQGVIVGLMAAAAAAYTATLLRDLAKSESTETIMIFYMLLATPALGLLMFKFGQIHSPAVYFRLIMIGVIGIFGMILITESLRHANIAVTAPLDYTMFIFSAIYGYFFWDAVPAHTVWFGLPLIIGSGLYIGIRERARKRQADAE